MKGWLTNVAVSLSSQYVLGSRVNTYPTRPVWVTHHLLPLSLNRQILHGGGSFWGNQVFTPGESGLPLWGISVLARVCCFQKGFTHSRDRRET